MQLRQRTTREEHTERQLGLQNSSCSSIPSQGSQAAELAALGPAAGTWAGLQEPRLDDRGATPLSLHAQEQEACKGHGGREASPGSVRESHSPPGGLGWPNACSWPGRGLAASEKPAAGCPLPCVLLIQGFGRWEVGRLPGKRCLPSF